MNNIKQQLFFQKVLCEHSKEQAAKILKEMRGNFPIAVEANALRAFADLPWDGNGYVDNKWEILGDSLE